MTMRKLNMTVVALVALVSSTAFAGRGASFSSVQSAIRSGNADAIIAELERAERLPCAACVEPVMALLDSDDYRIREAAAWWFARRPANKAEIRDLSLARLYGTDATLARNAADVLGTFRHPNAVPALSFAAGRADLTAEARVAAVRALGTIHHSSGREAVVAALADTDATVRYAAVQAMWELKGDAQPLVGLLGDADVRVRRHAAAVLGSLGHVPARIALEQAVAGDSDSLVRRNAAFALGKIGDNASRPVLQAAADNDESSLVRSVAAAAIRNLR
jgi:HEAT repeat protein